MKSEPRSVIKNPIAVSDSPTISDVGLSFRIQNINSHGTRGNGYLVFDKKTLGLSIVTVTLLAGEPAPDHACWNPTFSPQATGNKVLAFREISDALIGKYGTPSSHSEKWPSPETLLNYYVYHGPMIHAPSRIWKTDTQTIEESLTVACEQLFIWISYKVPGNSDL